MDLSNNVVSLSDEIESIETDALKEEQANAENNYKSVAERIKTLESYLPYPNTKKYETGIDYEDISRLKFEKRENQPIWDLIDKANNIYQCDSLYCGHFCIPSQNDYYITDNPSIETTPFQNMLLVNADDRTHAALIRSWRYPNENQNVSFSRNIHMSNRRVDRVDIIIDRQNEILSKISDSYLRKALIENKNRYRITSIIQTIQEKQDYIRSLDKNDSFVVQGCAGSGKTMVLLHRLRYLIFNKEVNSNNYFLLVPGYRFKEYISNISREFNIDSSRILSYAEYYQLLSDKPLNKSIESNDEIVFPSGYLDDVYSEEFIRENYRSLLLSLRVQSALLIEKCEGILNSIIKDSYNKCNSEVSLLKSEAVKKAYEQLALFGKLYLNDSDINYEQIAPIIAELSKSIKEKEIEIADTFDASHRSNAIIIDDNDPIIAGNTDIVYLRESIEYERIALEKAPIFTKRSHKRKLSSLEEKYNSLIADIIKSKIDSEKAKALSDSLFCEGVSLSDARTALNHLNAIIDVSTSPIDDALNRLENINAVIEEKYAKQIDLLNSVIEYSETYSEQIKPLINNLLPSINVLKNMHRKCYALYNSFIELVKDDSLSKFDEGIGTFRVDSASLSSYLYSALFGMCKKRIKEEHGIIINSSYKHYWYIYLYCHYLTNGVTEKARKHYLFMDEVQDLSIAEFMLIRKVNTFTWQGGIVEPVIDAFGDINQVISSYGVKNWDTICEGWKTFVLDENFRNTNQIIQYCNNALKFEMKKIGIDMNNVFDYPNLEAAISIIKSGVTNQKVDINQPLLTFIVKDDYHKEDLASCLEKAGIFNDSYKIFTVHTVKGLEFKEVYVVDCHMTDNEKYIAYTRPLIKLSVIHKIHHIADDSVPLYVQGNDE